jgi:hypothetical protein
VANAGYLAFNIWANETVPACFSAAAVGMMVRMLCYEMRIRRELAKRGLYARVAFQFAGQCHRAPRPLATARQ